MRILHLTVSTARGGRRDAILDLVDQLRLLGAECGLISLRDPPDLAPALANRVDYAAGLGIPSRPHVWHLGQVARLCRIHHADVVHAHDGASQFTASLVRLQHPRMRAVMTFHRTTPVETEGPRNRIRNAISLPLIDRVITGSNERRDYFISHTFVTPSRVTVIPFGVDRCRFHPDPAARRVVRDELGLDDSVVVGLVAGHFGWEKGIDQALAAAARATAQLPDVRWHLLVAGTGGARAAAQIYNQADRLLGDRVTMLGFRTDMERIMQASDFLIHAARAEAFGLVIIQAMATGLPVAAMAVGGLLDTVVDTQTGHLVAPGDVDALADAIVQLIRCPATRQRMGRAGMARAHQAFDARLAAERHLELYRQVQTRPAGAFAVADRPQTHAER
jgi:glycosyltransferase involved in cell wall biosynthesis